MRSLEVSLLGDGEERDIDSLFEAFFSGDANRADRIIVEREIDVALVDAERIVARRPKTLLSLALESRDEALLDVLLLRSPLLKSVDPDAIGGHLLAEACRLGAGWHLLSKAWRLCQNPAAVGPWGPEGAEASALGIAILESRPAAARFLLERGADPGAAAFGGESGRDLAARVSRERPGADSGDVLDLLGEADGLRGQWEERSRAADEALLIALACRDGAAAAIAFGRGAVFRWGDYSREGGGVEGMSAGSEAEALLALALDARDAEIAKLIFLNSKITRPELFERALRRKAGLAIFRMAAGFMDMGVEERSDETGRTLLHRAALAGDAEACQALLEAGADPEARTGWKRAPADIARESGDPALLAAFSLGGGGEKAGEAQVRVVSQEAIAALVRRARDLEGDSKKTMAKIAEHLKSAGGERAAAAVPEPGAILALAERFPVFREAIEDIAAQASLLRRAGEREGRALPLKIPNLLLLGKPGIGKTHFLRTLAAACGSPFEQIQMSSASAGFVLSGMDPGWSQARPGKVFSILALGPCANPIVLLDEIDKASGSGQFPVDGPLFSLLERETAREWRDEFADIPVDASLMSFIASANSLEGMHEAIVSRFQVYEIPDPDADEALQIARSVYRGALEGAAWGPLFEREPSAEVLEILAAMSPRTARQALMKAFGAASLRGKSSLGPEDFRAGRKPASRGIGFHS